MGNYEKNLRALDARYPGMKGLVEEAREKAFDDTELTEEFSCGGEPVLRVRHDGRFCYLNGKRETREPARMWVKSQKTLFPNAPIFIMGVGNWFYLEELVAQTKNRVLLFVYEPSVKIFLYFLEHADITGWMEKQTLVFWVGGLEGMDLEHMKPLLESLLNYEVLNLSRRLIVPNYEVLFPKETLEFIRECRDIAKSELAQRNTKARFSSVLAKNLLSNIRYLPKGYTTIQLAGLIPEDVPGILVAAGPSLNKNIRELKKARGRAFIIAVDTAIKPLLKAGILPDMFAMVDGKKPLDLVTADGADQIPLISSIVGASEVFSYHKGMKFFFTEGYQLENEILFHYKMQESMVPCGGSVATLAFGFLYRIGVRTVILVGQDLALTGGRSHADGTFQEKMEVVDTSGCIMVEGNCEEKVPTRTDFKIYLDWYEMYIKGAQKESPYFRVINATEGGAKIKHTEVMTLKEAICRECTGRVDIQAILADLKPMFHEKEEIKWVEDYIRAIPEKCADLKSDAGKAIGLYKKLDRLCGRARIDRKEYLKLLKRLDKQIKNIESQAVYDLVAVVMSEAHYIMKNEQFMEYGTLQEEGKEIARKGILYMENVRKCAEIFQEYISDMDSEGADGYEKNINVKRDRTV